MKNIFIFIFFILLTNLSFAFTAQLKAELNYTWIDNTTFQVTTSGGNSLTFNCLSQSKPNTTMFATTDYNGINMNTEANLTWPTNDTLITHIKDQNTTIKCSEYPNNQANQITYTKEINDPGEDAKKQALQAIHDYNNCQENLTATQNIAQIYKNQLDQLAQNTQQCSVNLTNQLSQLPSLNNLNLTQFNDIITCQTTLAECKGQYNQCQATNGQRELLICNNALGTAQSDNKLYGLTGALFASIIFIVIGSAYLQGKNKGPTQLFKPRNPNELLNR